MRHLWPAAHRGPSVAALIIAKRNDDAFAWPFLFRSFFSHPNCFNGERRTRATYATRPLGSTRQGSLPRSCGGRGQRVSSADCLPGCRLPSPWPVFRSRKVELTAAAVRSRLQHRRHLVELRSLVGRFASEEPASIPSARICRRCLFLDYNAVTTLPPPSKVQNTSRLHATVEGCWGGRAHEGQCMQTLGLRNFSRLCNG